MKLATISYHQMLLSLFSTSIMCLLLLYSQTKLSLRATDEQLKRVSIWFFAGLVSIEIVYVVASATNTYNNLGSLRCLDLFGIG